MPPARAAGRDTGCSGASRRCRSKKSVRGTSGAARTAVGDRGCRRMPCARLCLFTRPLGPERIAGRPFHRCTRPFRFCTRPDASGRPRGCGCRIAHSVVRGEPIRPGVARAGRTRIPAKLQLLGQVGMAIQIVRLEGDVRGAEQAQHLRPGTVRRVATEYQQVAAPHAAFCLFLHRRRRVTRSKARTPATALRQAATDPDVTWFQQTVRGALIGCGDAVPGRPRAVRMVSTPLSRHAQPPPRRRTTAM